ncbi:hypothetical protein KFK09_019563 [Dendrobium nobile]|uniref:Uncharacterized protein n=1 Tax=Dendrobium nobile TaxID=94219 RepID=A0A8T3AQJ7_DENNO|nr:hypothetical protein KFK09_019563 [Dendrobium nobile]
MTLSGILIFKSSVLQSSLDLFSLDSLDLSSLDSLDFSSLDSLDLSSLDSLDLLWLEYPNEETIPP